MDYKVIVAVFIAVCFYKMVAASKRAKLEF